jgi:hypothetical protein
VSLRAQLKRSTDLKAQQQSGGLDAAPAQAAPSRFEQQLEMLQEVAQLNLDQLVPSDAVALLKSKYNKALGRIDTFKDDLAKIKKLLEDCRADNAGLRMFRDAAG